MSVGEVYTAESQLTLPPLERTVRAENTTHVEGPVACASESPPRCVKVEVVSVPDTDDLNHALAEAEQRLSIKGVHLKHVEMTFATQLITDPETLLPRWYRAEKQSNVKGTYHGKELEQTDTDVTVTTFDYGGDE
jgi:hypothetical protein